jgi:AraC-like DNA-binding protein
MPIFMDRHDVKGISAEQVAAIHQQDLKIEHKYGCRALTYWFDEQRGTAFCLIEAPGKEAVKHMHHDAHGQVPSRIIEVEARLVESFLGRIQDPEAGIVPGSTGYPVFEDTAYRIVMALSITNTPVIKARLGPGKALERLRNLHTLLDQVILEHKGRKTDHSGHGIIVSFSNPEAAVKCALDFAGSTLESNRTDTSVPLHLSVGLASGEPVTSSGTLFEETIRQAERLGRIREKTAFQINISPAVRDLYVRSMSKDIPVQSCMKMLNMEDELLLNRLMDAIDMHWHIESFNVAQLGRIMGLSKSRLYRKVTGITGSAPGDLIRQVRLNQAAHRIERKSGNITEIAYESGFGNPSWFSKCFRKYTGVTPMEYAKLLS